MNQLSESFKALEYAEFTLQNSEYNLHGGFALGTINRAYYAMFYCMTALLFTENIHAKSHKGTLVKYEELFVKSGLMSKQTSTWVRDAFNLRQEADYDFEAIITEDEAKILVENARQFYNLTKAFLENLA
jgi:uncharacterized protein (UPF0332 family)